MSDSRCICGHVKGVHFLAVSSGFWCSPETSPYVCGCEGYQAPVRPSMRPTFGVDRMPHSVAEAAPAWSQLGDEAEDAEA